MSFSERVQNGTHNKEKRKPYYDSRRFDYTCRSHGSCGYCEGNRQYNTRKRKESTDDQIKDDLFLDEIDESYLYMDRQNNHRPYFDECDMNIDKESLEKHLINFQSNDL